MIYIKNPVTVFFTLFVLMLVLVSGYRGSLAKDTGISEVVFHVK